MRLDFLNIFFILFSCSAFASSGLEEQLIDLRAQVQLEADQLEAEKKSINAAVQSLTIEKGELSSQKKLLSQANKAFKKALLEKSKIMGGEDLSDFKGYADLTSAGLDSLKAYQDQAVPFKIQKRKKRITDLQSKFNKKEVTVSEYFEKYWSLLQDEIRLSESVEVQNDSVKIEGAEYKVKVLKLGMAQLYFKTHDGALGYAKKTESGWGFKFFENSSSAKGVMMLFAAKEKQIKGGRYELPLNFNESEVKNVF